MIPRHFLVAGLLATACAEMVAPPSDDEDAGDPPMLSGQTAGPQADQWLPSTPFDAGVAEPAGDAELGSPDSTNPGPGGPTPQLPEPPADIDARVEEPPPADLPDAAPPPPDPDAAVCEAETCNGLDDDCDGQLDEGGVCPCEVAVYAGRAYLVCNQISNWGGARQMCQGWGYDLAVIEDAPEDAFLFGELQRRGLPDTWVGLNDRAQEGLWVWLDGEPLRYTHWDEGEPNNGGDGGENCGIVMTARGRASEWDDRGCGSERPFLCEGP